MHEPKHPALIGMLKLWQNLHLNLFALSYLGQIEWRQLFLAQQLDLVPLQCLLHDLNNSVDLCHTDSAYILQFGDSLLSLRYASCNNDWFLYFFSPTNHVDKCSLRWVDDSTAVNQHQISVFWIVHHMIPVLHQLSHHELTVRNVMWAAKGLDKNTVSTRCFFALN